MRVFLKRGFSFFLLSARRRLPGVRRHIKFFPQYFLYVYITASRLSLFRKIRAFLYFVTAALRADFVKREKIYLFFWGVLQNALSKFIWCLEVFGKNRLTILLQGCIVKNKVYSNMRKTDRLTCGNCKMP